MKRKKQMDKLETWVFLTIIFLIIMMMFVIVKDINGSCSIKVRCFTYGGFEEIPCPNNTIDIDNTINITEFEGFK